MAKNDPRPEETPRSQAIEWWNGLPSVRKMQVCDTYTDIIGFSRKYETLTGREIENIWVIKKDTEK